MKLRVILAGFLLIFCVVNNAEAQMPEDVWREYQHLKPPYFELRNVVFGFKEPYYSLALKELTKVRLEPIQITFLLLDMMNKVPQHDTDIIFYQFWSHLRLTASKEDLTTLLASQGINKLPSSLDWFVDDAVKTLLQKELDFYATRRVGCDGHKKYRHIFLEKFLSLGPPPRELASTISLCKENNELFLKMLLNHPDVSKEDLLDVLGVMEKYKDFYDQYFSLLLLRQNEFIGYEFAFIKEICKAEPYCSLFDSRNFSAVLERREKLLEIMRTTK
ncbi:MAG: hypothetical protein AAB556_00595 [Patescibacteria group bacterium]